MTDQDPRPAAEDEDVEACFEVLLRRYGNAMRKLGEGLPVNGSDIGPAIQAIRDEFDRLRARLRAVERERALDRHAFEETIKDIDKERGQIRAERDAAVQRAEAAEKERDALKAQHWSEMVERYRLVQASEGEPFLDHMVRSHDGEFVKRTDFQALRAERDAAIARAEKAERGMVLISQAHDAEVADNEPMFQQIDALLIERDRLREALRKYGKHTTACDLAVGENDGCICGFRAALDAPRKGEDHGSR